MGRPKVPLISKENALEVALRIVDKEGLSALSIRHLAEELGVTGASLYYHFENKEEILVGVAELALSRTPLDPPDGPPEEWPLWLLAGARQLRDLLRVHPQLLPVIVQRRALGMGNRTLEVVAVRLVGAGVPISAIVPLFESLEHLVIGFVVRETAAEESTGHDDVRPDKNLILTAADTANDLSPEEIFNIAGAGIIDSVVQSLAVRQS